jgi:hypothetical protein
LYGQAFPLYRHFTGHENKALASDLLYSMLYKRFPLLESWPFTWRLSFTGKKGAVRHVFQAESHES